MFSQFEEEEIILDFWSGRVGSFLDIGAWDGIELSNTRALVLQGWRGVLVEPAPAAFVKLLENTTTLPGMICVNAAVSGQRELRKFHLQSEWGGTLNDSRAESNIRPRTGDYYVLTISPADLLQIGLVEGMNFEFVSIDAEWMDTEILASCAGLLTKTELLCVEVTDNLFSKSDPVPSLCSMLGFNRTIGKTRSNILVAR